MSINDAKPSEWDEAVKCINAEEVIRNYKAMQEDVVNKPHHYNTGNIECIDAIKESMEPEQFQGYLKGNCFKYLWRHEYKGKPVEDLRKARWYLDRLIKEHL